VWFIVESIQFTYSWRKSAFSVTKLALLSQHFCAPRCSKTHIWASRISTNLGRTPGLSAMPLDLREGKRGTEEGDERGEVREGKGEEG